MLRSNKILLCAALLVLLCVFTCLLWIEFQPAEVPFYLEVQGESGTERYACWRGENQQCYVFLPGYAEFSQSRIVLNTGDALYLDGESLDEETDCSGLQEDCVYELEYRGLFGQQQLELTFIRSDRMPVIHIDTESGNMDYIHGRKGNEEKASIRVYSTDGALVCSESLKSIAARGNSTFDCEKKPYIIKFNEPIDMLGMGAAEKWLLLANALDQTNLRNHLVMETARKMGLAYTPDMQWAELYLNHEYAGLYLLSEKIEVNENRVDIPAQDSYVFSLDARWRILAQNLPHYETAIGQAVRIRHPETLDETTEERIASIVQRAETAILAEDGIDPESGAAWDELIDVDSWARKYLVEEIFASADAGKWSQYFYVTCDGEKICAGPVWDYDLSMAVYWQLSIPNTWYCNRLTADGGAIAPWFDALNKKPEFMQRVVEIYQNEVLPIMLELIDEGIDRAAEEIARPSAVNDLRWSAADVPKSNVEQIREYLRHRIEFLNDVWIEGNEYVEVTAYLGGEDGYVHLMMPAGSSMDTLPALQENDLLGWYWTADGTPVEPDQKVMPGAEIYALRAEPNPQNDRLEKLTPLGILAMMGFVLAFIEIFRLKSRRWHCHG